MTTSRGTAFTTTMRVVDRVHRHAANGRANTTPARSTGFTQRTQAVLGVRDFAQGRTALSQDFTHFTGAQTQGYVRTFTRDQLGGSASGASDLSAFTRLQLDTMNSATHRDVAQRHAVACLDRRTDTGDQLVTCSNALGGDDVATLAVCILQQSDVCSAVRIVFDAFNDGRDAILVATEVDQTVVLLVTTTDMTGGDTTVVVTAARLGFLSSSGA